MTVLEILTKWLESHGYDGLFLDDEAFPCGCRLGDLAPCCRFDGNCEAAYDHGPGDIDGEPCDFVMRPYPRKPRGEEG